ncbi:MAG TPA: hypothetical protein VGL03_00695 [Thermoanaerobaculia bacterium]
MIFRTDLGNKGFFRLRRARGAAGAALFSLAGATLLARPLPADWPQWGHDPQHSGAAPVLGQPLSAILADLIYDPFVPLAAAENEGELLAHYPVPLIDGADVYMEFKSGRYVSCDPPGSGQPFPCGPDAWDSQRWSVKKLEWKSGALVEQWSFASDWRPEPPLTHWEPVFHPVLSGESLYVPGLGGSIHKVSKATGEGTRIDPFGDLSASRYVAGGLAADSSGAVVYNAIELGVSGSDEDVAGAWLVRVAADGRVTKAPFDSLVPGAPGPADACQGTFSNDDLPWPPSPAAVAPTLPCGSQRPGLNVIPAVAADGTIYTVSRAHFSDRYSYLVAVHPDLTPAWSASLRGILDDGCGVRIPPNGSPGGCRAGAVRGVDPATNDQPAGRVADASTSSPVVLPDGAILYGAFTRYNYDRGHLFKFSAAGDVLATYDFGWDITPAIRMHDGTYSILLKDNHYEVGSYCSGDFCPAARPRYDIASLDANLVPEWTFTNTTTESCARQPDGSVVCLPGVEDGFEWCVNQPAIDGAGVLYANSEDGFLYAIDSSGRLREKIFLDRAIGAAYTPVSLGADGIIYAQNNGRLFAVGLPPPREAPVRPGGSHQTRLVGR